MIRTSSAAAEIDKPLRPQSKAPDAYSRVRECVCDCKCNAIEFNQTCHMNTDEFPLQPAFWVPPSCVQKLCMLLRDQNTCLTSWHWAVRECVCDCKCNAIEFNQTCHMNSLCNQSSGCLTRVFQGNFQRLGNFDFPHRLKHLRHSHSRDRRKALWQKQHDFTCSLLSRCVDAPEINVVAMSGAWLGARNGSQFKERS